MHIQDRLCAWARTGLGNRAYDLYYSMLKNNTLPMGKVGEMVGFRSESLFYRKFKAIMGVSPKVYAKQNKNK